MKKILTVLIITIFIVISFFILNEDKNEYTRFKNLDIEELVINTFQKIEIKPKVIEGKKATRIAVLNYHFFYDPSLGEKCNETICLKVNKLEEHIKYLKDNNYKILTMKEYVDWIYKKIELPEKSVLITVDDGAMGTSFINGNKLIPLLEKYKVNATLFLITAWWDIKNYQSNYLEVESHGFNVHRYHYCNNKNKPLAFCMSDNELKDDLSKSISILNSSYAFCYPFYRSDERYERIVQEVGFKVAFLGGNRKSTREDNKYKLPRYAIQYNITMNEFIRILN